jgi:transcriptional regulator with XRE-family HTH domain
MTETSPHHARLIGEKLRAVRQEHKMSLRDLADKAEVSASMLSQTVLFLNRQSLTA